MTDGATAPSPSAGNGRLERWGAAVNQWGAVVAAIIAAISAAAVAIVSANTSASTLHSEAHRAGIMAERNELKSTYVNYYKALYDIDDKLYRLYDEVAHRDLKDPKGWANREHDNFQELLDDFADDWVNWVHAERAVELIPGPFIAKIFDYVADWEDGVNTVINNIRESFYKSDFAYVGYWLGPLDVLNGGTDNVEEEVKLAARADLTQLGYGEK